MHEVIWYETKQTQGQPKNERSNQTQPTTHNPQHSFEGQQTYDSIEEGSGFIAGTDLLCTTIAAKAAYASRTTSSTADCMLTTSVFPRLQSHSFTHTNDKKKKNLQLVDIAL